MRARNGAAESQVPADHVQALQSAMSLLDGEQVEHRLGRWCPAPSSIQDRNGRGISGVLCRTLSRVSWLGDDVGVSIHHLDRIEQVSFTTEDVETSPRFTTSPPSRFMAVSKDIRVLVLGSKKRLPRILPRSKGRCTSPRATGSNREASSRMSMISSLLRSSIVMRLCIPVHRFLHSKRPDLNIREGFMGVAARVPSMSSVDALAEMVEQAAHRRRRSLESATMSVLTIQLLGALWLLQPTVGSLLEGQQRPLGPETVGGAILALLFALILLDLVDDAPRTRTRVAALATIGALRSP